MNSVLRLRPSIALDSKTLHRVSALLRAIEDLDDEPTGVLRLYPAGQVYLESGRVCWALFPGQQARLVQLLRHQRNPPIPEATLSEVIHESQSSHTPFVKSLVDSGKLTREGLRAALLSHSAENMARMAHFKWSVEEFVPFRGSTYGSEFVFSTVELLTSLGASKFLAQSGAARRHLSESLKG